MDPLGVLNHLSGVMTPEMWQAFKATDDYLWLMARAEGYRGNAMKKLARAGRRRRAEAWEVAKGIATNIIQAEIAELPLEITDEQAQMLVIRLAEKLMCEQNYTPPTFTAWAECETCGRVPVPPDTETKTPNCPWCMP